MFKQITFRMFLAFSFMTVCACFLQLVFVMGRPMEETPAQHHYFDLMKNISRMIGFLALCAGASYLAYRLLPQVEPKS